MKHVVLSAENDTFGRKMDDFDTRFVQGYWT